MGRAPRILGDDVTYHVTARGNERHNIFRDSADRAHFLERLEEITDRTGWSGLAYCLMDNHVHLAFSTPNRQLTEGMRDLLGVYARSFNKRHRRVGHLFGNRFHATVIDSDSYLYAVLRYIARNPVAAGLATSAEAWPWSSYPALVGQGEAIDFVDEDFVLGLFHRRASHARSLLRTFIDTPSPYDHAEDTVGRPPRRPNPWAVCAALSSSDAIRTCLGMGLPSEMIASLTGRSRLTIDRHRLTLRVG